MAHNGYWLAAIVGIAVMAAAAESRIDSDRMLLVDGQRTFVLGLYENPSDDAGLEQVARAGFNLVQVPPDGAALDRLRKYGLHAWINTGGCIDLSEDRATREAGLRKLAAEYGPHPGLLAWEVPDEALWNCWYGPMQWRREREPALLAEKIEAVEDKALAERLRAQRAKSDDCFRRCEIAESERLADDIWRQLGEESPGPARRNLSQSAEKTAAMAAGLCEGYAALKQADPNHAIWMNHAPRNSIAQLETFGKAADAVGCDIYPVPPYGTGHSDLADRSLASVGAYTLRMQASAPGKPVWMVLQGFGWADLQENPPAEPDPKGRRPTFDETRFMAYDAIVRGARGLLYWGTYRIEKESALWSDIRRVVRELADLQPVLSAPDREIPPDVVIEETWGSLDLGVVVLAKTAPGGVWFLAVNEDANPLCYTLSGLTDLEGRRYRDARAGMEATVADGRLTLRIAANGVHVMEPVDE